ncbi:hypothetical protein E2F47_01955 [Mycobacterium eburneum]|nr:hypothetical protein [Mycobacterium eburneum]TDH57556.1 hypothetical protein E2F47_01955 [Mycobacterium eburneum]
MYTGPVLFPAGLDPATTQTAVFVLGPNGGTINVPPLAAGQPGPPPVLRNANLTEVPYGENLPSPAAQFVEVSPGSAGVASVWDLDFSLHAGSPGDIGTFLITAAQDIGGTLLNAGSLVWNAITGLFETQPQLIPIVVNVTGIGNTAAAAGATRLLQALEIPAQKYDYIAIVLGDSTVTGTANTQVDLVARLNSQSTAGVQLARGRGQVGAVTGTNPWVTTMIPNLGALATDSSLRVTKGNVATIYFNAEQQASTGDQYTTTGGSLTVVLIPCLPSTAATQYLPAPTGLTVAGSATGGSFAAGTYYWVVTAINANGETLASNEVNTTLSGSTSEATLAWSAVSGATGYKVYRGIKSGGENALITTISSQSTTTYTDTGAAGSAASPPTTNTASE